MRVMDNNTRPVPIDRRTAASGNLTPEQRSQRARVAALARWSRQDGHQGTQAARETFLDSFARKVDPNGELDPAERERRATAARREHFTRMAMRRHAS